MVWRELDRVVGQVALQWVSDEHQTGEIGFVNPDYGGRGVAHEAAEAI